MRCGPPAWADLGSRHTSATARVLMVSMGGATESARAAKCLSNMRNLASGCLSYGMNNGYYPRAASVEYSYIDETDGIRNARTCYGEFPGWISWNSSGQYANRPTSPPK